jgi:phosphoglucomutase
LKAIAESGWFAARPSGTESIYKIYAESFRGADHLRRILEEARTIVGKALASVSERVKARAAPPPHAQTVSEAEAVWRNEGNPN